MVRAMRKAIWLLVALVAGIGVGGVLHYVAYQAIPVQPPTTQAATGASTQPLIALAEAEGQPPAEAASQPTTEPTGTPSTRSAARAQKVLLYPWLKTLIVDWLALVGQVFLRLIFMIVVPLVVSALLLGVYELGVGHGMGRVFAKTLGATILASTAAVIIGITLVTIVQPGEGSNLPPPEESPQFQSIRESAAQAKPLHQALIELLPRNPLASATRALEGEIIALMVACLILGAAMSARGVREKVAVTLIPLLEQIFAVCIRVVEFAMVLAPAAVFTLVLSTAFQYGFDPFWTLGWYAAIVVLGLLIQQFLVYPMMLTFLARRSPWKFFADCREVYVYAFSTSSSNATLPKALETAEKKLDIPSRISRFVLTVGATANQNGTALFEGITVLFLAQVFNVELSLQQQIVVVLMSIVAGIGTAGVPGGSLPLIMILMSQVGIPPEGIALILGVDRFLDMCRTVVNVSGDLVIAAVVGQGEPPDVPVAIAAGPGNSASTEPG
jgi:DAACS family dicarboxylate/amino acid:cation (Na+ or H+) symporter